MSERISETGITEVMASGNLDFMEFRVCLYMGSYELGPIKV